MKKNYDFSKGEKNPYFRKLRGKKFEITEEISFELSDLIKEVKKSKIRTVSSKVIETKSQRRK